MKKIMTILIASAHVLFLVGCSSTAETDITDYLTIEFNGYDTVGEVKYTIDEDQLMLDTFDATRETVEFEPDEKKKEMINFLESYSIEIEPTTNLSNGDEVSVNIIVDEDRTRKIKSIEESKYIVEGLKEPTILSSETIKENLDVNFVGFNGRGKIDIVNNFKDETLKNRNFISEQDGTIRNNDTVIIEPEDIFSFNKMGYFITDNEKIEYSVDGLTVIPDQPSEIANLDEIHEKIDSEIHKKYKPGMSYTNEITLENTYYRQFDDTSMNIGGLSDISQNGALINLYSIDKYQNGNFIRTERAVLGVYNIILDEGNKVNIDDLGQYFIPYVVNQSVGEWTNQLNESGFDLID